MLNAIEIHCSNIIETDSDDIVQIHSIIIRYLLKAITNMSTVITPSQQVKIKLLLESHIYTVLEDIGSRDELTQFYLKLIRNANI